MALDKFDSAELARLHGCLLHAIDGFAEGAAMRSLLSEQMEMIGRIMIGKPTSIIGFSLSLALECVQLELVREAHERREMQDGNMLSQRYRYAGKLESLRAKIETMIKESK